MGYGVIRTDKMFGTRNRAGLASVIYMGSLGDEATAIENGSIVAIGALIDEDREVFAASDVSLGADIENVVLIATPEVLYDERKQSLDDYINEAGCVCRGYRFHDGDIFSITDNMFSGLASPAIGNIVEVGGGTKLNITDQASQGATVIGSIIAIENVGKLRYIVVGVDLSYSGSGSSDSTPNNLVDSAVVGTATAG